MPKGSNLLLLYRFIRSFVESYFRFIPDWRINSKKLYRVTLLNEVLYNIDRYKQEPVGSLCLYDYWGRNCFAIFTCYVALMKDRTGSLPVRLDVRIRNIMDSDWCLLGRALRFDSSLNYKAVSNSN